MARSRIVDPAAVPVAGSDGHLPPIAHDRLGASALRERFARIATWEPEHAGDGAIWTDRAPAQAAVLVPLIVRDEGLHVLLTRRADHLRDHAGQVSFPGGRTEPGDQGPAGTALREAAEEVGLAPDRVQVIGQMPTYTTVTGFVVTPVVGLVDPGFVLGQLVLDTAEVAEAFEVPLVFLMNPAHHRRHLTVLDGVERRFLSMPWQAIAPDGSAREYFIWGATAAMLRNLYRFLSI